MLVYDLWPQRSSASKSGREKCNFSPATTRTKTNFKLRVVINFNDSVAHRLVWSLKMMHQWIWTCVIIGNTFTWIQIAASLHEGIDFCSWNLNRWKSLCSEYLNDIAIYFNHLANLRYENIYEHNHEATTTLNRWCPKATTHAQCKATVNVSWSLRKCFIILPHGEMLERP